jgi:hypothetical protein
MYNAVIQFNAPRSFSFASFVCATKRVKSFFSRLGFGEMIEMGRAVATKGHRRLGKTIRILESSVELSTKETQAKVAERQYKAKVQPKIDPDSPVENLRDTFNKKKAASP